jgi:hypothetical protein
VDRPAKTTGAVLALLGTSCGGMVEGVSTLDGGTGGNPNASAISGDSGSVDEPSKSNAGGAGGGLRRALEMACPDAATPQPIFYCELFAQSPAGCPVGQACYPEVIPGNDECDPSTFTSSCQEEGTGTQGTPCSSNSDCQGDFVCVGTPSRCAHRCGLEEPCSDGLVCEGVVGFDALGACV